MLKEIALAAALTLGATFPAYATPQRANDPLSAQAPDDVTLDNWISAYSSRYSESPDSIYDYDTLYYHVKRVSLCETANWTDFTGDNGLSLGPMQFHRYGIWPSTPQAKAGFPREDYEANIAAGVYLISLGYGPAHWVYCWRNAR